MNGQNNNDYTSLKLTQFLNNEINSCQQEMENQQFQDVKRRTQCEFLNMRNLSSIGLGRPFGAGAHGTVNSFTIDPSTNNIPTVIQRANNNQLAVKTEIPQYTNIQGQEFILSPEQKQLLLQSSQNELARLGILEQYRANSIQQLEALIGLRLNSISDMTPNFPYYHDIRKLTREPEIKRRIMNIPNNSDGVHYGVITEAIQGETLGDFVDRATQDTGIRRQLPDILKQIAITLYIANQRLGFVHFDLHSGNILITPTDQDTITYNVPLEDGSIQNITVNTNGNLVKIIDFGFSSMYFDEENGGRRFVLSKGNSEYVFDGQLGILVTDPTGRLVTQVDEKTGETTYVYERNPDGTLNLRDILGNPGLKPTQPYVAYDIWTNLIDIYRILYYNKIETPIDNPIHGDIKWLFGNYARTIEARLAEERKNNYQNYTKFYTKYVRYLVNLSLMTDEMKNNLTFTNKYLTMIHQLEMRFNNGRDVQPVIQIGSEQEPQVAMAAAAGIPYQRQRPRMLDLNRLDLSPMTPMNPIDRMLEAKRSVRIQEPPVAMAAAAAARSQRQQVRRLDRFDLPPMTPMKPMKPMNRMLEAKGPVPMEIDDDYSKVPDRQVPPGYSTPLTQFMQLRDQSVYNPQPTQNVIRPGIYEMYENDLKMRDQRRMRRLDGQEQEQKQDQHPVGFTKIPDNIRKLDPNLYLTPIDDEEDIGTYIPPEEKQYQPAEPFVPLDARLSKINEQKAKQRLFDNDNNYDDIGGSMCVIS
jgi:serine/threonine protein kinase